MSIGRRGYCRPSSWFGKAVDFLSGQIFLHAIEAGDYETPSIASSKSNNKDWRLPFDNEANSSSMKDVIAVHDGATNQATSGISDETPMASLDPSTEVRMSAA